MPTVSPCEYRLVKQVNNSLQIAVTYSEVPDLPDLLDVSVELINTRDLSKASKDPDSSQTEGQTTNGQSNGHSGDGWFSGFWPGEAVPLSAPETPEVPLFLGYIQLVGYVRINRQIGSDSTLDASTNIYWKNQDYLSIYEDKNDTLFDGIAQTPFMKDHGSNVPRKGRIGGIGDLNVRKFDNTSIYLLHDLAHSFNTSEMPSKTTPAIAEAYQQSLASDLSQNIIPFYVTAQHLLFSSLRLESGGNSRFQARIVKPSESMPPSYNTRLTGSAGESGAVSICYSFVVGVLEQSSDALKPRAVYFPIEIRPGFKGLDRDWLQKDFLQDVFVDKSWVPTVLESQEEQTQNGKNASLVLNGSTGSHRTEKRFARDLDTLIESSIHVVAANERRKSSVSFLQEYSGFLQQVPRKLKILYQIRVNNQTLCTMTLSKPYFHVGDDVNFFLELHTESNVTTRIVGYTCHVEAHEIFNLEAQPRNGDDAVLAIPSRKSSAPESQDPANFHVEDPTEKENSKEECTQDAPKTSNQNTVRKSVQPDRKVVNVYKVTPTIKINTFADALADAYHKNGVGIVAGMVNLPRFLTQQFQASSFMDLKYFLVCRFVLNEFAHTKGLNHIDDEPKQYADYIQEYKFDNESTEFKFLIPLTVLP